jgi:uncharacterized protein (DUF885 family)
MSRQPFEASLMGVSEFDATVPDVSVEGEQRLLAELDTLAAAADRIDPAALSPTDQLTLRITRQELADQRADVAARWPEITADSALTGPQALALANVPKVDLRPPAALAAYRERLALLPRYFAQAADRLRGGLAAGRAPTAHGASASIAQIDGYLATPLDADVFVRAAPAEAREDIVSLVREAVRPALADYAGVLADLRPAARPDEQVGAVHVPGGADAYRAAVRRHTTTTLEPDDVHRIGLDLVAALRAEVAELAPAIGGTGDPSAVFAQLLGDENRRFASAEDMLAYNRDALARAEAALPSAFGLRPRAACGVRPMDPVESAGGTLGYYQPPRIDDGSGATYWLNVADPSARPRFEYEALTFHEAVPGHHTQTALAMELHDLPDLRRAGYIVAYCEGWALYTERLADEMGLYTSVESRLGMLSFALWRAGRLVIDTGMHWHGWSRDRARAYFRENTGLTARNIDNEVDRYIGWPGQATGYMIGCQEILRLRTQAQAALGERFRLPGFHDAVLGQGPLHLSLLAEVIDAWIAETKEAR